MKKFLFLTFVVLLTACTKTKEPVNNLNDLLSKHLEAIGSENLKNCQSILHRDQISLASDGKITTEIEVIVKKPNNYFFKSIENGDTLVLANNTKINWAFIQKEYKERPAEKSPNSFNMYAYGFSPLYFAQMNNWKMEYTGREKFNGKDLYRIKVIQLEAGDTGRDNLYIYDLDPETFLIVRMTNGGSTQYYSDYKEMKGIKYASKISSDSDGIKGENYFRGTITEFKVDIELPDALFEPSRIGISR